jgi:hypothetical protein
MVAILDFIKQHRQQQQAAAPAAQVAMQAPAKQDVAKVLSASELAKAKEAGELFKRANMRFAPGNSAGESGSNAALLQKQNNQDKTQAALSPTDRFAGQTVLQKKSRGWER